MDKVIYICHEFGGDIVNKEIVAKLIEKLVNIFPNYCFVSPIHSFGYLYDEVSYERGMEYCITLLDMCDEMWVFGDKSMSKGCLIEKRYCDRYKIPIVDKGDYIE